MCQNFGGDPVTQLNFKTLKKNYLRCFTGTVHHSTGFAAVAKRCTQAAGVWKIDAGIKWPYQPKHSPSCQNRHTQRWNLIDVLRQRNVCHKNSEFM